MKRKITYWIYILACTNGTYYTGMTKNLPLRFEQHVNGKANSKYTRSFRPTKIVQSWQIQDSIGIALKVEQLIKKQPRKIKTKVIENPDELKTLIQKRLNLNLAIHPVETKDLLQLNSSIERK